MTAFVAFLRSYAVWLYLICALGILVGIKILTDARRLARTTLFSLEQERAGEQTYRGITLIIVLLLAMGGVTTVIVLGSAFVPTQDNSVLRGPTPTFVALVFPTSTAVPTVTATLIKPTETPFVTSTPVLATPTRFVARTSPATVPPTTAAVSGLPAPVLIGPPNSMVVTGLTNKSTSLTFKWTWDCTQCALGPNDNYVISITYTDRSGKPMSVGGGPKENYITMDAIMRGYPVDIYQQAKEDTYYWSVQVKRGEQPLSPPSETWRFVWH